MLRYAFLAVVGLIATTGLLSAETAPAKSPPAAAPPAAEPANGIEVMEDPQTGDHWTYELRDDITGDVKSTITNTVTDVSGSEISIRIAQSRKFQLRLPDLRSLLESDEQRHLAIFAE